MAVASSSTTMRGRKGNSTTCTSVVEHGLQGTLLEAIGTGVAVKYHLGLSTEAWAAGGLAAGRSPARAGRNLAVAVFMIMLKDHPEQRRWTPAALTWYEEPDRRPSDGRWNRNLRQGLLRCYTWQKWYARRAVPTPAGNAVFSSA